MDTVSGTGKIFISGAANIYVFDFNSSILTNTSFFIEHCKLILLLICHYNITSSYNMTIDVSPKSFFHTSPFFWSKNVNIP